MGTFGTAGLGVALALALCGMVLALVGASTGRGWLVEVARQLAFVVLMAVVVVNGTMLAALLGNRVELRYVAENSSSVTPTFFKVLALWAADDGSLLLWNLILAGYLAAVAWCFRDRRPATFPYALGVMFAVQVFYLVLVNGPASVRHLADGELCDVAPTILELMHLPQPKEMTGHSLLHDKPEALRASAQ